jgi:CheY-like chemotaxis protein
MLNIGVNACDALPSGGNVMFATSQIDITGDQAHGSTFSFDAGSFLQITVEDNGVGMDEETRSRIFEPFFTTKEQGKGTGLGMASVYGTVQHHNGFIELKSRLGKGTTCIIGLPLCAETPTAAPVLSVQAASPLRRTGRVLIVDDVQIVREMIADTLREEGYVAFEFSDGFEAIEWYRTHHEECDLVILDYTMPGISGRECFMKLKEIRPDVKAIITSGHALDDQIGGLLHDGACAFVQKPFEGEQLTAVVGALLTKD